MKIATTQTDLKAKVLLFALSSRIFIIFLSWISNTVIPDHEAGVYIFPQPTVNNTSVDRIVKNVFGGLERWDAQYFLHIAHFGYTYENTLAFFPLFPYLTRILAQILRFVLKYILNPFSTVLISAIIINIYFFVNASLKLFELSCKVLKDDALAYKSAIFFCINPASIFFTAPYSESCYAFFTFSGMLFCVESGQELLTSFALGLSSCARSNGVINIGYIMHKSLKYIFINVHMASAQLKFSVLCSIFTQLFKLCIYTLLFFAPFLLFQGYTYITFCMGEHDFPDFLKEFGKAKGFVMPTSEQPPWCNYTIPFSYSYVQNKYWDVGFLKYYRFRQLPNFILALPVIFLILRNSYIFISQNKKALLSLGFAKSEHVTFMRKVLMPDFFVFVFHAVFMTLLCALFVHIQVTTRIIASSCPVFYWFIALHYKTETDASKTPISSRLKPLKSHKFSLVETQQNMNSVWRNVVLTGKPGDTWSYIVRGYFYLYLIVGTILFSNFLPWT